MGYVVTSACAMVKVGDRLETLARGAAVPEGADPDHVALLVERGMLVEGEPTGFEHDPDIPPPFVAPTEETDEKKPAARGSAAAKGS